LAIGVSGPGTARAAFWRAIPLGSDSDLLRLAAVAGGLAWAFAFPLLGVAYALQTFGDGALFSYAVAARDAWAFHWHNISGRLFVFLVVSLPAQTYGGLTGDPQAAVALYGSLYFAAPLAGLVVTFAIDRREGRQFFVLACASTACLCPLVFGSPTEMWVAHAVFWPALAAAHCARRGYLGLLLVFALMLALVFTHEGALLLAGTIVVSLLPRGLRDADFRRGSAAFLIALSAWVAVKLAFPPDPYIAEVLMRLAFGVFDLSILDGDLLRLIGCSLAGYALAAYLLSRLKVAKAADCALALAIAILAAHWLWFDQSLHADNRYYLRTIVIVATPLFGLAAARRALGKTSDRLMLPRSLARLIGAVPARAMLGLLVILTLIHAVEAAKFISAWTSYREAVRTLAASSASDPALGDPRFVSSDRIDADARLGWASTTPFLSVLVTRDLAPAHIVVAPDANFFWISCETATANAQSARALPAATRDMLRAYSCLHR